jgi:hypothetical protein
MRVRFQPVKQAKATYLDHCSEGIRPFSELAELSSSWRNLHVQEDLGNGIAGADLLYQSLHVISRNVQVVQVDLR